MKAATLRGLALTPLCFALSAAAVMPERAYFNHKDWSMVCDNTGTCRVDAYEASDGTGGSLLLTREAGPNTPVTGQIRLGDMNDDDKPSQGPMRLAIDGKDLGTLPEERKDETWQLNEAQTAAVINAVKGRGNVVFKSDNRRFALSAAGASAVLLKMDDVQGRVGTPGALIKKGDKPESAVPAAVPAPVIHAAVVSKAQPVTLTGAALATLLPRLEATKLDGDSCDGLTDETLRNEPVTVTPLSNGKALIAATCWRAAYNEGNGYWVIDEALKGKPTLITLIANDYDQGVITSVQRGRGIGDCMSGASWTWNGDTFVQSDDYNTGECRLIRAGGTWEMPTLVTTVIPAK
ncbi:DUF1176 domain-containing protein [Cronobacter muytjensii]|uniref:DUF1176 domain-containing protein n=1 Tax=Cronobacter muytjensii TaxID=413501 RepID=UPI00158806FB|nr:DUF1176 domain-containing protein [Cronobacter muytjensii]EGT4337038.1 DUF1176 domain-containing protein [Cronobacter muytjensii]EGT4340993.1 DUF1176 domain-containing protein [Cronobacter muytjensii]ELY4663683.1 DUF1176 domain-containing protein [Cronobacter muytjensii]ELY4665407.1 DUF1176 domain-containing protein [Cronobacter muytjensii]ELY4673179.1 DUF1176 domain-containing protein [Cronobacter muytjensii]